MEEATLDGVLGHLLPDLLYAPASEGQTLALLRGRRRPAARPLRTVKMAPRRNDTGTTPARAKTTMILAGDGAIYRDRVIAPGETVTGRVLGGWLILAGPEYEYLLAAGSTLAALTKALTGWQAEAGSPQETPPGSGRSLLRRGADRHRGRRRDVDDPAPATAAAAVAAASRTVTQLNLVMSPPTSAWRSSGSATTLRAPSPRRPPRSTVVLDVRVLGPALPGEQLTVRVTALNRGLAAATAGVVTLAGPAGWTLPDPTAAFSALPPGGSTRIDLTGTVAQDASGDNDLTAALAYAAPGDRSVSATLTVAVQPLYDVTPDAAALPLAASGWNRASFTLRSNRRGHSTSTSPYGHPAASPPRSTGPTSRFRQAASKPSAPNSATTGRPAAPAT